MGVNRAKIMSVEARQVCTKTNPQQSKQPSNGSGGTPHRSHSSHILQNKVKAERIQHVLIFMKIFTFFFIQLSLSSACMSKNLQLPQASWLLGHPHPDFYICTLCRNFKLVILRPHVYVETSLTSIMTLWGAEPLCLIAQTVGWSGAWSKCNKKKMWFGLKLFRIWG